MRRVVLGCAFVTVLPAVASARTWYVDDDNKTGKATGSEKAPFPTLVRAFEAVVDGDTIKLARGTYPGSLELVAERGRGHALTILGGYPGGTSTDYAAGRAGDFGARTGRSIVRGVEAGKPVFRIELPEGDLTSKITLEGLVVRGGSGHDLYGWKGGGLYARGGALEISDTVFEDNRAYPKGTDEGKRLKSIGGGAFIASVAVLDRVIFRRNVAGRGGGLGGGADVTVQDSLVCDNVGESDHGGGIYLSGKVTLLRNYVVNNVIGKVAGYGWGGGILAYGGKTVARLEGNRVTRNYAPTKGSGVFIDDEATATLTNELYWDNDCPKDGGAGLYVDGLNVGSTVKLDRSTIAGHDCPRGVAGGNGAFVEGQSLLEITRSIFWGNGDDDFSTFNKSTIKVAQSVAREDWGGAGNSDDDPKFVDAKKGDFHLRGAGCRWDAARRRFVRDKSSSPWVKAKGDERGAYAGTAEASMPQGAACGQGPAPVAYPKP